MSITINGTTGIAGVDGSASTPAFKGNDTDTGIFYPSANEVAAAAGGTTVWNASSTFGFKNRIINGSMDIWQRGTSTTATGNTYLADRWASAFPTGGTVSQETSSLPTGSRYAWKFVASASNAFMQMGQQIEYMNCLDLQNTTVTISFMARSVNSNAGSTALTVRTRTIAGIDGTCLFAGTNSDTSVTLTTTWTRYTVTKTLPTTFGSLSLEFVLGANVSGDGIMLSQVQMEFGSVASSFDVLSIGTELALCQRYFYKTTGGGNTRHAISGNGSLGQSFPTVFFKVTMRTTPSVSVSSVSHFNVEALNGAGSVVTTSISWNAGETDSATLNVTSAGSGGAGCNLLGNNSSAVIGYSAEF